MYYELFRVVEGEVQPINAREAQLKEIRQILARDKGSKGDSDGRKKAFALKELGAVYWIADFRSPGRMQGYEEQELIEDAIKNYDLPATWKPDLVVTNLIKTYEYNNKGGVAAETLSETVATLRFMNNTVKEIRRKIKRTLEKPDVSEDELKNLITLQREIFNLSTDIPKKIKEIQEAIETLRVTEAEFEVARGGVKVTSSMI